MSSAPQGWYVDPSTGTNLRFWSGSTWTDEVAPLPYESTGSRPVDLFGSVVAAEVDTGSADAGPAESEATGSDTSTQVDAPLELDASLERTRLSRRELRARRGSGSEPDDTPGHLPPLTPPAAVSIEEWSEAPEELEIPARAPAVSSKRGGVDDPAGGRGRVIRIAVLLAILALATTVAVLTGGAL